MKKRQKNTPSAGGLSHPGNGPSRPRDDSAAFVSALAPISTPVTTAIVPVSASAYSRNAYAARRPKKHRGLKAALVVLLVLLLGVGGAAFGGIMYVNSISDRLHENVDQDLMQALSVEKAAPGEPFYMLIMGVDRSEERVAEGDMDTFRSDSMILTRVDPVQKNVSLVSIERDTYVNIAGYGADKINASAALGGSALVVDTISKFAGVPISHYVEIDFDGFKAAVDALGGIEVDVPITIDDDLAGGRVEAGLQTLNGDQALVLCRSRHAYDDYGSGDYYRMANQRMVMGAIAKKILSSDVVTMANTINAMADYITTDMDVQTIIEVATEMRGMDADQDIYSAMNPTIPAQVDGIWYEYCDLAAWQTMMGRVDAGLPPYADGQRNLNDGGTLDGTITGVQEYVTAPDGSIVPADGDAADSSSQADPYADAGQALDASGAGYVEPVF